MIHPNTINLLRNFRGIDKFKKEALKITVNMLNDKEIKDMREAFLKFDINNTGKITFDNFFKVMKVFSILILNITFSKIKA